MPGDEVLQTRRISFDAAAQRAGRTMLFPAERLLQRRSRRPEVQRRGLEEVVLRLLGVAASSDLAELVDRLPDPPGGVRATMNVLRRAGAVRAAATVRAGAAAGRAGAGYFLTDFGRV
eukprot:gene7166-13749_t